jgi:hypothetical protein
MPTQALTNLQQNCRALHMCVNLCAGQSLSFTSDTERAEKILRNSYRMIVSALKKQPCDRDGEAVRLNPSEKSSFVFCHLRQARELASYDILRFALGTTEWGYQGMIEIDDSGRLGGISWQFYTPRHAISDRFGPYRYTSGGLSCGAICKKGSLGTGVVLLPFLLSRGIDRIVKQSPKELGVTFQPGRFGDARIFPDS